jgi:outer membrane protein OmpA-like peptidoglycan-associated protein
MLQRQAFWALLFSLFWVTLSAQSDTLITSEVRFALDSDRLSAEAKQRIDSLLKVYPLVLLKELKLYGHTDSLAKIEYNRDLSKRRVQAVLQYLVFKGLNPMQVQTDFYGEERPRYSNAPDERYKNRRVELEMRVDLSLLPDQDTKLTERELKSGDKLRLANLNFVGNQAIPVWQSFDELRDLLLVMKQNPDLEVSLQGHVCCSNDFELSVARARMVYNFLIENGISKVRLEYKGFGNKVPLYDEVDEESRALNRRVEVEVLYNSEARQEAEPEARLRVEAPVMSVKFVEGSARLTPTGDFMLSLIADMLKDSEGLRYEFIVYNNIADPRLSAQRGATIERTLRRKGVRNKVFKVSNEGKLPGLPDTPDHNWIRIRMIET